MKMAVLARLVGKGPFAGQITGHLKGADWAGLGWAGLKRRAGTRVLRVRYQCHCPRLAPPHTLDASNPAQLSQPAPFLITHYHVQ
jgi:hypothetical protein